MLGKRVLVIEDDKDSLHAISELLRRAEYEVLTAESGREGLRLLHGESPPDLVVLDVWLPDMTGQALLSMRTRWPSAINVPVLLLAGDDAWIDDVEELKALGVAGLLRKPVEPEELLNSVAQALRAPPPIAAGRVVLQNDDDTAVAAGAARQMRRLSDLLTRVSEVLAQGLDIGSQLRDVARAIVPAYATACIIERVDTAASVRDVLCTQHESSSLDVDLRSWARQPEWLAQVLSEVADSGKPRLLDLNTDANLLTAGTRADIASARALGFESVVVVPMVARRRLFGLLTCASRATRRYTRSHIEAFADLGHRIALALDNAELGASAQQTRHEHDVLCHALTRELKAPLAALTEVANTAVERARTPGERSLAETFLQGAQSLAARLQALTAFAGCNSRHLQMNTCDVELAALVRASVDGMPQAPSLQLEPELSGLHVRADPERLRQALDAALQVAAANLAPGGKMDVTLTRPPAEEAELHLTVRYPGPCLPSQQLAGLGQLTAYDYDAAALVSSSQPDFGLHLARALVEAQNGRFWVETQHNIGNSIHIALPLSTVHLRDTKDEPPPHAVILLVDSDLAFRRELQEILSERGYHVETADNGLQAWQYLLAHPPPALILFDLVLPAMDGWELHAAIKSHAVLQAVPTVVVSGLDRYRIEASLPDAHGYIEKPIRSAQLFEMVQKHVVSPARPRTLSVRPSSSLSLSLEAVSTDHGSDLARGERMTEWLLQHSTAFAPRGGCYGWHDELILLQVVSNGIIACSLLALAITLAYLFHAGKQLPFKRAATGIAVFIVACAGTHLLDVLLTWKTWYWLDGGVRAVAAVASIFAALLAPRLVPRLLALMRSVMAARQRGLELAAAVESLEGMYETTRELERLKTHFFANISHELRTPLTLVLGPTERLLRSENLNEQQRRDAELVLRNARTLLRHVNDMLDVSRLEAGKLEPRFARSDLSKLLRRVASCFDALTVERGIRFVVEAPEALSGELDAELTQRVLLNLLANAFKYTPAGGLVRISLKEQSGKHALIEVADSGPGVRPEHRSLIFERFQQADNSSTRRFGGAGLGLAIAKDFIELHEGNVSVADAPEGGALFSVELPLRAPEGRIVRDSLVERPSIVPEPSLLVLDELWSRDHQADSSLPPAADMQRPLVLVVEDNPAMNRFVCETLSLEYRTESALDGRAGLEKALRVVPDLILTDLMMPGMSGDQLVQAVRNSPELDDTPVVLLSARGDDELRARMLREGVQDFMLKPFSADELRARVGNLISMKRARQVLQQELSAQMLDLELMAREVAHQKREMHAALEVMRSARETAEQANRQKSAFLNLVSQELRTPLATLALQLERLQRSAVRELPHDKHLLVRRMGASVGRLSGLCEGLLQYARIESGRLSLRTESLDVAQVAADVLAELRAGADDKGVELCLEQTQAAAYLDADRELVRLILFHLVENGLRSTEQGQVRVSVSFDERSCRLTVADSGPGIPREQQAHIFHPYEPSEQRKHGPPAGLGLSLVRQMVDALGGSITLTSRVGQGTKFSVRLPHRHSSAYESPLHAVAHA